MIPVAMGAQTQTTETKSKTKVEDGKMMKYTGCVQTGTETRTYVLQHAVPVATTQTVGTAGTMTSTTYALIPEATVELQERVGHKVEVTGVMVPAGSGDTKVKTKTETESGTQKSKAEFEQGSMPQLKVISVKPLAESCSE